MIQNQRPPIHRIAFPILIALSISHCLNDMLQSVISAVYPLFKEDLSLSFAQIGLISVSDVGVRVSASNGIVL